MTWTFGNDPLNSKTDEVRVLIGDINPEEQLLSDEIINYFVTTYPNVLLAASYACRAIVADFSRLPNTREGDVQVDCAQIVQQYTALAEHFRCRANANIVPKFGIAEGRGQPRNPEFTIGQFDSVYSIRDTGKNGR